VKLNYDLETYISWITIDNSIIIERRLANETAFDGIVKIYSLKSNNSFLNKAFEDKYFGEFIHIANTGFFLRMFKNKTSWPVADLVYVDYASQYFENIKETNSSWNVWYGQDLGKGKHIIEISPKEKIEYQINH